MNHKIRVLHSGDFGMQSEMISNGLPETGEYILVRSGDELLFALEQISALLSKVENVQKTLWRFEALEKENEAINLDLRQIHEKIRKVKIT